MLLFQFLRRHSQRRVTRHPSCVRRVCSSGVVWRCVRDCMPSTLKERLYSHWAGTWGTLSVDRVCQQVSAKGWFGGVEIAAHYAESAFTISVPISKKHFQWLESTTKWVSWWGGFVFAVFGIERGGGWGLRGRVFEIVSLAYWYTEHTHIDVLQSKSRILP